MNVSKRVEEILFHMTAYAEQRKHEFVTPEHLLYALLLDYGFIHAYQDCGGRTDLLRKRLEQYFDENISTGNESQPLVSYQLGELMFAAETRAAACEKYVIELAHLVSAFSVLEDSYAAYFVSEQQVDWMDLLYELCEEEEADSYDIEEDDEGDTFGEPMRGQGVNWKQHVSCMNDSWEKYLPLIGREDELERTIQILCRKEKNNPLHIGEPGVGKTAIVRGLVRKIEHKEVPELLFGAKVFEIDMGTMLAGTQYRGDFEKRFKSVMEGIAKEEKPIVYLDEIHTIIGAGSVNGGSLDAANILKPYLAEGTIRFIGATTVEEYNKYLSKSRSLLRRFQTVSINEPDIPETIEILQGLKRSYEEYHRVRYSPGVLEYAAVLSSKYVNERFLPDKAIDLMDEAGAYRRLHPQNQKAQTISKKLIEEILAKTCNIPKQTVEADELQQLKHLEERLNHEIFGQEEAIHETVNAVKLSRAGLAEENKPVASLLFVGPTGVGKTEVAKCLARELGIRLIRFDMSEYAEKHTVAKLIGSPAGYVGYEEGGLLTDSIRKTPHCVLLLDEIEKAHNDIYNILLQIMDYATLTDSQGRKADFRNVIIIMTSNAGARNIGKNRMGFIGGRKSAEAMDEELKRIFSPEFRNRLSGTVRFHFVDDRMAERIVKKQLVWLQEKLAQKNIRLTVAASAAEYLKTNGVSDESGARGIEHLITSQIKPLFMESLLFGSMKKGGYFILEYNDGRFQCKMKQTEKKNKIRV